MYDDMPDDNYIQEHDQELADRSAGHEERDEQDEALNGDYTPGQWSEGVEVAQEARNTYTDALARVVADTMALATIHGKEGVVSVSIDIFLDTLEAAGFAERAEVLKRATFILSQND